jgi:hypothetical protein
MFNRSMTWFWVGACRPRVPLGSRLTAVRGVRESLFREQHHEFSCNGVAEREWSSLDTQS